MEYINGGVCAAKGFLAGGVHCGLRKNASIKDLALIYSTVPASAAAVYTQNLVKGSPIIVTQKNISDGKAQAIICNSGNANTCNADGEQVALRMCQLAAKALDIAEQSVIVASTGVIGQPLPIAPIAAGVPVLAKQLSAEGGEAAAQAIMTTDTAKKEFAVAFTLGCKACHIGGIAKGSGMIHPNMATMLGFITTDAAITPQMLQKALSQDVADTFNMVSVDGDTSTNDMVAVLANGLAQNPVIDADGQDFDTFCAALKLITQKLSIAIAKDGEGATKLLTCNVSGAPDEKTAKVVAKGVICSSLVKAAMFGADANWGRVLCAIGYSGAAVDVQKVGVVFASQAGEIAVCQQGAGIAFSEELAKQILTQPEICINVTLDQGEGKATAWGCDLTYDYVKINGDYRT